MTKGEGGAQKSAQNDDVIYERTLLFFAVSSTHIKKHEIKYYKKHTYICESSDGLAFDGARTRRLSQQ